MLNFRQLMFDKNLTQRDLAKIMGVDQPAVSGIINGRKDLRKRHVDALVAFYGAEEVRKYEIPDEEFYASISRPAQITFYPTQVVEEVREEVRHEVAEEVEIKETIILTPEQINQENIDLKKEIEAGTLDVKVKPTQDVLPTHHAKVYTENDEMSPEIEANDPVFVRFLANKTDFINGRMYFVDLDNGSVVRWVVREDDNHVRLISMKDEEVVPLASVRSISEVVAITKRPKTLPKERVTIEEAIARKDNQLDTLLEQQGRLIGIIEKHTN